DFFFFQAEDGIRDRNVTGVQTCALPIFPAEATDVIGSSLGAAITIAEQLPTANAEHLTELAQQAFVDGLSLATIIGGGFLVLAAIVCPILIQRGRKPGERQSPPTTAMHP